MYYLSDKETLILDIRVRD